MKFDFCMLKLLAALTAVESGGNAYAVGDNGSAVGCLQITRPVVVDVNRVYGSRYKWPDDCYDKMRSQEIATLYLHHYLAKAPVPKTAENAARIWNGGPTGYKKPRTCIYWRKVNIQLKQQETK